MTRLPRGRIRSAYWAVVAVVLAAAGAICLVVWSAQSTEAPAEAPDAGVVRELVATAPPTTSSPIPAAPARPVVLRIPRLGMATRLSRLGLREDGSVQVPHDAARAGWFRLGPPPGAPGSSVILGHVDSSTGPGVFFRLPELQRGDSVVVELEDGSSARFEVHSVRTYLNADFPAQKVYGNHGRSELNMVTCGGAYDEALGGYQANVVVNARRA